MDSTASDKLDLGAGTHISSPREDHIIAAVRRPLPLEWFAEIEPRLDGRWIVKGLMPAGGLALLFGHPGTGKSFVALDLALHIALGKVWHGRKTERGLVIYVAAEGQAGMRLRVEAFRREHGCVDVPFALIATQLDLLDPSADLDPLIYKLRQANDERPEELALLVVDTLSRTFGGGEESGPDMAAYVTNIARIQSEFSCAALIIHHRPKNSESETPRGHGSLWGACDTVMLVESGSASGEMRVRITKQKDADPGEPFYFRLRSVDLGVDEDNEVVTSCVVEPSDTNPLRHAQGTRLSSGHQRTFQMLERLIVDHGKPLPQNIRAELSMDHGPLAIPVDLWRATFKQSQTAPEQKPDSNRRMFCKHLKRLQELDMVQVVQKWAWPKA